MRMVRPLALSIMIACLAGCSGVATRNAALYDAARSADVKQAQAEALAEASASAERAKAFAALAAKCADSACISALGDKMVLSDSIAALKAAAQPDRTQTAVPYERDGAAKFRDFMGGINPTLQSGINAAVAMRQSDNSTKVQLGDQATTRAIVESANASAASAAAGSNAVAQSAIEHAQPNITVGGDFVSGTQHTGDEINGSGNATRGAQNGDAIAGNNNATHGATSVAEGVAIADSTDVAVEQGDGDQTIEKGPGDQQSPPTTIITTDDGNECTGADCQSTQPVPDPDGGT